LYVFTLNEYLKRTYGQKLYKVSLDGGMTCPNRDGKIDTRGCVFCSKGGSGEFAEEQCGNFDIQFEKAKERIKSKTSASKFIAYFQSYTNTYADIDYLKELFYPVINRNDVAILSIATRPDCLPDEVIELLSGLNKIKPVWVELGLQTVNIKTVEYIRRGYDISVYDSAVKRLKAAGIYVVVHTILYLPGETEADMEQTVKYISKSGADGIKLQLLHVLKGTDLELDYISGLFTLPNKEQYFKTLGHLIELLPSDMAVHRMTGDGAKRILIAPLWTGNKKDVLNSLNRYFTENNIIQGRLYDGKDKA